MRVEQRFLESVVPYLAMAFGRILLGIEASIRMCDDLVRTGRPRVVFLDGGRVVRKTVGGYIRRVGGG